MAVALLPFVFPGVAAAPFRVRCWFQIRPPRDNSEQAEYAGGNLSFDVGDTPATVAANREAFLGALRAELGGAVRHAHGALAPEPAVCELRQVHGCELVFDPEPVPFTTPTQLLEGDGMATDRPGRALLIKTADCQPVMLAHESGRCVAALHVGWRGNRANFPGLAVRAFCERYGVFPHQLFAVRGPSLGPSASEFVHYDSEWGSDFDAWHNARAGTVDLWRLTRAQLAAAGLREERIFGLDLCTHSLGASFFSYRRNRICGRQAGVIMMVPAAGDTAC